MPEENKNQSDESITQAQELSVPQIIDVVAKSFAVFVGIVYVCGFLTLNSHLNKYGIFNLGITNSDYLLSGASFTFFIVTYSLFGGRGIVFCKHWMEQDIQLLAESGAHPISARLAFIHSFIELFFLHCVSVALFAIFAINQNDILWSWMAIGSVFCILYPLDVSNFDLKRPFAHLIIKSSLKLLVIIVFFLFSSNIKLITIFFMFMMFSGYINFVLDGFERYRITTDNFSFSVIYSAIFFLSTAVAFGSFVYGDVNRNLGGGKSLSAEIGLRKQISDSMEISANETFSGEVIFSSETDIYLNVKDKAIALPRRNILWIRSSKPKDFEIYQLLDIILNTPDKETSN